jgi:hypothetical protein
MHSMIPRRRMTPFLAVGGALCLWALTMSAQAPPAAPQAPPAGGGRGAGGGGGGRGAGGGGGRGAGGGAPAAQNPQAAAPIDLTGYWVSLVTEDWLYRMRTPEKGDMDQSVPMSQAARAAAMNWDPDKDTAAGEQCKSYGVAAIMRVPGRLHITWQDENTLKVETDAGTQTRLLHFGGTPPTTGDAGWQGYSVASWDGIGGRGGRGGGGGAPLNVAPGGPAPIRPGSLKVITTMMKSGYIRKNGVPYSASTKLTEFFDRLNEPNGDTLLLVSTTMEDPQFLTQPFLTSTHFKKEPDGSKWSPSVCSAK